MSEQRRKVFSDDVYAVRRAVGQWLRIRGEHIDRSYGIGTHIIPRDVQGAVLQQLAADADHSDLLERLLFGEEPLPFDEWFQRTHPSPTVPA